MAIRPLKRPASGSPARRGRPSSLSERTLSLDRDHERLGDAAPDHDTISWGKATPRWGRASVPGRDGGRRVRNAFEAADQAGTRVVVVMNPSAGDGEIQSRGHATGGGFSVLDGAAVVVGATIASVHLRDLATSPGLSAFGWGLVWITLTGIAISATGPFLFVLRKYLRRVPAYPRVGDTLWMLLGLPWVLSAPVHGSRESSVLINRPGATANTLDMYAICLWGAQAIVCMIVLVVVWKTWVLATPEVQTSRESLPWTDRLGVALAVAWPLQCGLSLVVVG